MKKLPALPRILLVPLSIAAAFCSLVSPGIAQEEEVSTPNIVVIVADDISHKYLGTYGGPTPTPHLDLLAEEGTRFDSAYAVTPLCNPSRYTLLAGQYPGRNRNLAEQTPEDEAYHMMQSTKWRRDDPSIARVMKEAGYFTGFVGKWHSEFDIVVETLGQTRKHDPNTKEGSKAIADIQKIWQEAIAEESGFDRVLAVQMGNAHVWTGEKQVHNPEYQTWGALEFLEEAADKEQPFFMHLANSIPHYPNNIESLEADARYTGEGKWEKTTTELAGHPPRKTVFHRLEQAGLNTEGSVGSYNAGAIVMDDQLAILQDTLEEMGVAENTVIIWLGDHNVFGKGSPYAPGLQVPLIVSWPEGLPVGLAIETPVSLVDLFRTCAALADAPLPENEVIDGVNLLPLIEGETDSHPPVYSEYGWSRGIIDGHFHYVAFRPPTRFIDMMIRGEVDYAIDDPAPRREYQNNFANMNMQFKPGSLDADQLYDLRIDPFERTNLAHRPAYEDKVREMKSQLSSITDTLVRPFPVFEVHPFLETEAYRELIVNRRMEQDAKTHHPAGYDAERIFNMNLLDPLNP